jgi:hypothetical protein
MSAYQGRSEVIGGGLSDGRNVQADPRWGAANADDIRKYAAELVAPAPDVKLLRPTLPLVFDPFSCAESTKFINRVTSTEIFFAE